VRSRWLAMPIFTLVLACAVNVAAQTITSLSPNPAPPGSTLTGIEILETNVPVTFNGRRDHAHRLNKLVCNNPGASERPGGPKSDNECAYRRDLGFCYSAGVVRVNRYSSLHWAVASPGRLCRFFHPSPAALTLR
jgi:hypothetical protein